MNPLPYGQLFVIFFGLHLTLEYDLMCSETEFAKEKIVLSNYNNHHSSLLLAAALCSLTKWSDSGIAEALGTRKMHF